MCVCVRTLVQCENLKWKRKFNLIDLAFEWTSNGGNKAMHHIQSAKFYEFSLMKTRIPACFLWILFYCSTRFKQLTRIPLIKNHFFCLLWYACCKTMMNPVNPFSMKFYRNGVCLYVDGACTYHL